MQAYFRHHADPFPRAPLLGAAALIMMAMGAAFFSRATGIVMAPTVSTPIEIRELHFADRPDGGVNVYNDIPGRPIDVVTPGTNGFLRALMRGLANERKREHIGTDIPFRLTAWADGRLTLDDTATRRHVELEAFGPTNAAAFARFLKTGGNAQ